jgi:chorismate mutase
VPFQTTQPLQTTQPTPADTQIDELRRRIDEVDAALIALWEERATLSREIGTARMAAGGTRLVLAREQAVLDRFRAALGADGTRLGMLLLKAGRGSL